MSDLSATKNVSTNPIPRPLCIKCGVETWLAMAPPRPTADIKEDWLFRCPICTAIIAVTEP
jgi:hypothetical protein